MKPQLIITQIEIKKSCITLPKKTDFPMPPAEIAFDYEISVVGSGDFSNYVSRDGTFNKCKLAMIYVKG